MIERKLRVERVSCSDLVELCQVDCDKEIARRLPACFEKAYIAFFRRVCSIDPHDFSNSNI